MGRTRPRHGLPGEAIAAARRRPRPWSAPAWGRALGAGLALTLAVVPTNVRAAAFEPPSELVQPVLQNTVDVEYPAALLETPEPPGGTVIVKFVIGVDGVPFDLEVAQSVDPRLDAVVVEAVGKLRYTPGSYRGKPVEIATKIAVTLAPPPPPEPEPEPEPAPEPAEPPLDGADAQDPAAPPSPVDPNGPVRIRGQVLEAGVRNPVAGASVIVVPAEPDAKLGQVRKARYNEPPPAWQVETTTDAEGRFEVAGLPDGKVRVIVLRESFDRLEFVEPLPADQEISVRYYQVRTQDDPYRTVVRVQKAEREEVARRTITREEINKIPGTQGDALKAIQNFPGFARSPFGIGLLVVRGTGPNDSAVYLGEHEIPQLFHFGGLTSTFNSDILETIDFIPGNFDSRFGDAIGGIIAVTPRAGRTDGYHGYIDSDIFDTGVLVEGPYCKDQTKLGCQGSFAISGRRSYIDLLLPVFLPPDVGLDATIAPRYYDYQFLSDHPLGPEQGTLTLRFFGSDDRAKLIVLGENDELEDQRDRFETTTYYHRADLLYRNSVNGWDFLVTPSYRKDFIAFGIGDLFNFDLESDTFSGRFEVERRLSRRADLRIGAEVVASAFTVNVQAPPIPDDTSGSAAQQIAKVTGTVASPALYTTLALDLAPGFTLYPGVRFTLYGAPSEQATTDPRLRFAWNIAERTTLKGGVGLYSQFPAPPAPVPVFGNPRLSPERGLQTSLGISQGFGDGFTLDATVFYNVLWQLSAPTTELVLDRSGEIASENNASIGRGRVYGAELLLRKELTRNVFGWVAYTISRSERRLAPDEPFVPFDFDQTHILTLIGSYKFPRNWQLGARFRLTSGNPETPVIGAVYDADSDQYIALNGALNSGRLPLFHQLDVRVDKTWTDKRTKFTFYLDVQNVYNQQNSEFRNYSYDFSQSTFVPGLPIIPSVGQKFEW